MSNVCEENYDAVVIGGGIQGAGCAQALSAKGYSVLLVDKSGFGEATSSKSSKLVHGGLRYLESGQFSLVRKSLAERATLVKIAPDLVSLKRFYLPVYRRQRLGRIKLAAGLTLYSLLGGLNEQARFSIVPKNKWSSLPDLHALKKEGLQTVFQYWDAQTDDQLLTIAVVNSAKSLGCDALPHTHVRSAQRAEDRWQLTLQTTSQHTLQTRCRVIVNAAGPWVESVQQSIANVSAGPAIDLVQGSHIEFDTPLGDGIFYVESPVDQRAVFIMPWHGHTLVGTTEHEHHGPPELCTPSADEIEYLRSTLRHYFPHYMGKQIAAWSGLRVLPSPTTPHEGQSPEPSMLRPFSNQARDTIVHCDNPAEPTVIGLYGGKLTAYRVTAADVAERAARTLGPGSRSIATATLRLSRPTRP